MQLRWEISKQIKSWQKENNNNRNKCKKFTFAHRIGYIASTFLCVYRGSSFLFSSQEVNIGRELSKKGGDTFSY
jgi:hypothetical protein